ncbi:MAG: hypothetical protein ACTSR3_06105 [Candidatus Helarchaeota archaeon]
MLIIGIIGVTIIAIIFGISQMSTSAGISFGGVSDQTIIDILVLQFIMNEDDPNLRTILLILWLFGFFTVSSED